MPHYPEFVYDENGTLYQLHHVPQEEDDDEENSSDEDILEEEIEDEQSGEDEGEEEEDDEQEEEEEIEEKVAAKKPRSRASRSRSSTPVSRAVKSSRGKKGDAGQKKSSSRGSGSSSGSSANSKKQSGSKKIILDAEGDTDEQKLESAKDEVLSKESAKKLTEEEEKKQYRIYKQWIRRYEKKHRTKQTLPLWKKADKKMTKAAATHAKYLGLQKSKNMSGKSSGKDKGHLVFAIPALLESAQRKFTKSMEIVKTLNPEEAALFWEAQKRNRNVTKFEDLVTKKKYQEMLIEKANQTINSEAAAAHSSSSVPETCTTTVVAESTEQVTPMEA